MVYDFQSIFGSQGSAMKLEYQLSPFLAMDIFGTISQSIVLCQKLMQILHETASYAEVFF